MKKTKSIIAVTLFVISSIALCSCSKKEEQSDTTAIQTTSEKIADTTEVSSQNQSETNTSKNTSKETLEDADSEAASQTTEAEDISDTTDSEEIPPIIESENYVSIIESENIIQDIEPENTLHIIEYDETSQNIETEDTSQNVESEDTSQNVESEDTSQNIETADTSKNIENEETTGNIEPKETTKQHNIEETTRKPETKDTQKYYIKKDKDMGIYNAISFNKSGGSCNAIIYQRFIEEKNFSETNMMKGTASKDGSIIFHDNISGAAYKLTPKGNNSIVLSSGSEECNLQYLGKYDLCDNETVSPTKFKKQNKPKYEADKNCEVEIDASITRLYRAQNGMAADEYLSKDHIKSITELTLWDEDVVSLKGLENFKNLRRLVISQGYFTDISVLAKLTSLETIDISYCYIKEIPDFSKLKNLRELRLICSLIEDISPVNKIPNLEYLVLSNNRINKISCLKNNKTLKSVEIDNNAILDYSSLIGCNRIINALNSNPNFKFDDAVLLEKKAKKILSEIISDDMTELEKEFAIYTYIIDNTTFVDGDFSEYTYGYRALITHEGVCGNYAESFALLACHAGLEAFTCGSDTHTWNIIKIDGKYYHCDALWDEDRDVFNYFNKSSAYILNVDSHNFNTLRYPECRESMDIFKYYDDMMDYSLHKEIS